LGVYKGKLGQESQYALLNFGKREKTDVKGEEH